MLLLGACCHPSHVTATLLPAPGRRFCRPQDMGAARTTPQQARLPPRDECRSCDGDPPVLCHCDDLRAWIVALWVGLPA